MQLPATQNSGNALRLTRRGKVVFSLLAMSLSLPIVGFWSVAQSAPIENEQLVETETVTVAPGDTLWEYAQSLTQPGDDIRDLVAEIKTLNHLHTSDLQAGQRIYLPTR